VWQHREGIVPGFTRRYRIHRLVYYEPFRDVRQAIARETGIKKWRRERKIALIEAGNPAWDDLALSWFEPKKVKPRADSSLRSE